MAEFALACGESPPLGLRRTAEQEVQSLLHDLERLPTMEAIHEFRRGTKRIRALLRLTRDCGDEHSEELKDFFKELASKASEVRDLSVRIRLLRKLRGKLTHPGALRVCKYLEQRCLLQLEILNVRVLKAELRSGLHTALRMLQFWPEADLTTKDLEKAWKRASSKACKASKRALDTPSTENLHEWRKRVKTECAMQQFLRKSAARSKGNSSKHEKKLTDLLGDDHDFALLERSLARVHSRSRKEVQALIAECRQKLQKKALAHS